MAENIGINDSAQLIEKETKPRILLIEDDEINANVIFKFLKKEFDVDVSYSGREGLERIKTNNYALILLDINLGTGISGLKVLDEIKAMDDYKSIPVIASTAYTMKGDKENLIAKGFDDYISKPFTLKEINEKLIEHLKNRK